MVLSGAHGTLLQGGRLATEPLVVILLENVASQTSGEQHPQFFTLRKMFCSDGAATDHGLCSLAHRIAKQDAVDLAHRASPIIACTDEEGVGKVEAIGLRRVKSAIKEVFDRARHIAKIFRCAEQYPLAGEQIL